MDEAIGSQISDYLIKACEPQPGLVESEKDH